MRNNNSDYNSEAVKIANALKPMFKTWFDEWARSCVRVKKMTVSTAPSNGIVGVKDAFSDKEIFAKYTPSVANAKVGDTVWCRWYFDNMQTLYASDMGNVSSADASFDNATINNDLYVYGDLSIGSTTLTEAGLEKLNGIGTEINAVPDSVSHATGVWKTLASVTLTKGIWIVTYAARWNTNANGRRKIVISKAQDSNSSYGMISDDVRDANADDVTFCKGVIVPNVSTASTTYYLNGYQNSGSALTAYGRIYAFRIG